MCYSIHMGYKKEDEWYGLKMGRPTDNRKGKSIHVRLDEQSDTILEIYTKQENISRAEAIRRGIYKLESDINK